MAERLQPALVALIPALIGSGMALFIAVKGWRRSDVKDLTGKVEAMAKQLSDLAGDVSEIKGELNGALPHVRDCLTALESGGRRR
ncbi:MAG: hypothetical protein OXP69_09985 [Spirochaetaceae bacterium]|nr:hypothetical protein [Spirochaetaceae bacterium]